MKVAVSKWAEIPSTGTLRQGEGQVSQQGCKTCSRCALGESQQGTELTCELPLSQAQGLKLSLTLRQGTEVSTLLPPTKLRQGCCTEVEMLIWSARLPELPVNQNLTYATKTPGGRYWPLQETDCIFNFPNKINKNLEHFLVTNYLASARALSAPRSLWQGLPLFLHRILQVLTAVSQSFSKWFCTVQCLWADSATPDAQECISLLLKEEMPLMTTNGWVALMMSDSAGGT